MNEDLRYLQTLYTRDLASFEQSTRTKRGFGTMLKLGKMTKSAGKGAAKIVIPSAEIRYEPLNRAAKNSKTAKKLEAVGITASSDHNRCDARMHIARSSLTAAPLHKHLAISHRLCA